MLSSQLSFSEQARESFTGGGVLYYKTKYKIIFLTKIAFLRLQIKFFTPANSWMDLMLPLSCIIPTINSSPQNWYYMI